MQKMSEASLTVKPQILVVDDEVNILQAIKRSLRKQDFEIILVDSGEKGLTALQQHKIDLIICDMKMPGMQGAEFFTQVVQLYPDIYRILLTGFADMESTIKAINQGKIHRYVQKPWDNDELIQIVDEGLEKTKLKHENIRLQGLLKKQNGLLKKLNSNLDDKVQLRTKQIRLALARIERDHKATQKVLYNLISINPDLDGGFANSVSLLAKRISERLELPAQEIQTISFAALISEVGLLGLDRELYTQSFNQLNYNQKVEYIEQTNIAQLILSPAQHLNPISDIITCQFELCNGTGLNKLRDEQIPIGAKILAVARDYWLYSMGRITGSRMSEAEVRVEMKKSSGTKYNPKVLGLLLENPDMVSDEFIESPIPIASLTPGMVLKHNIFTNTHMLILPEGHVFTEVTIEKLINFEETQASALSIVVIDEEKEDNDET